MEFLRNLFGGGMTSGLDKRTRDDVEKMILELIDIGKREDFLSERAGGSFNAQCHNIRTRAIGKRLNEMGGLSLMQLARKRVRQKLKANLAAHLDYAWAEIGEWKP